MEDKTPFDAYAEWNDKLLFLIMNGKSESKTADIVREQMDIYWSKMTPREQDLMRKRNEGRRPIDIDELLDELKDET